MIGNNNYYIMTIAIIICIMAIYSTFNIVAKNSNENNVSKWLRITATSIVIGIGVWSLYFIEGLATFNYNFVSYDVIRMISSLVISLSCSFVAFFILFRHKNVFIASLILTVGIVAMQHSFMFVFRKSLNFSSDFFHTLVSAIIAILASFFIIVTFQYFQKKFVNFHFRLLTSIAMSVLIYGINLFHIKQNGWETRENMESVFYTNSVTTAIFLLFVVLLVVLQIDKKLLERIAYLDETTGLPNRNELNRFFSTYQGKGKVALLFIDLDRFKQINDTLGHMTGDLLVKAVAIRLRQLVYHKKHVFRIGGDEFLFLIENCELEFAEQLADEILHIIKQPFYIDGHEIHITGSIGISLGMIQVIKPTKLLRSADTAMYVAKELGKNQYYVYHDDIELTRRKVL